MIHILLTTHVFATILDINFNISKWTSCINRIQYRNITLYNNKGDIFIITPHHNNPSSIFITNRYCPGTDINIFVILAFIVGLICIIGCWIHVMCRRDKIILH